MRIDNTSQGSLMPETANATENPPPRRRRFLLLLALAAGAGGMAWRSGNRTATERALTGTWSRVVAPQRTDFLEFTSDGWLMRVRRITIPGVDGMAETRETCRWFAADDRLQFRQISDRLTVPWTERFVHVLRGRSGPGWSTARVRCEPPDHLWVDNVEYTRTPELPPPLLPE